MTEGPNETHRRILDATFDLVARIGLSRVALEDVATEAGVSRQTVYRHFGSRDGLLAALIVREEEELLDRVHSAAEGIADVEEAVGTGLEAALRGAEEHPLLQRLLESEPELLLPFLTLSSGPVVGIVGPAVSTLVEDRTDVLDEEGLTFLGDAVGRVVVSYVINPDGDARTTAHRLGSVVGAYVRDAERQHAGRNGSSS